MHVFGQVVDYSGKPQRKLNPFSATIIVIKRVKPGPRVVQQITSDRSTLRTHHLGVMTARSRQTAKDVINQAKMNCGIAIAV